MKNSTGYSLKDLIIGSEGTLGIITEAVLKLIPLPRIAISLLIPFATISQAIECVPKLIKSHVALTAVEFMERSTILFSEEYLGKRFPGTKDPAYLLLTVDGDSLQMVNEGLDHLADICLTCGATDVLIVDTVERKESVWSARGAFLEAIKASTTEIDECDVVVPRNKIADFVNYTQAVAGQFKVRIHTFGHAGDGNLHIYICRDHLSKKEWTAIRDGVFKLLYAETCRIKGLVSGEHGIGYAKKEYLLDCCGAVQVQLMRGIKAAFDPNCILNPEKIM